MLTALDVAEVKFAKLPRQSQLDIMNAVAAYTGKLPSRRSLTSRVLRVELLDPHEVVGAHRNPLTPYRPKVRRFREMLRAGFEFPPIIINTLIRDAEGPIETLYEGRHRLTASAEENVPVWSVDVAQVIE